MNKIGGWNIELIPTVTLDNEFGESITGEVVRYWKSKDKHYIIVVDRDGERHQFQVESFAVFMEQLEIPFDENEDRDGRD